MELSKNVDGNAIEQNVLKVGCAIYKPTTSATLDTVRQCYGLEFVPAAGVFKAGLGS